MNLVSVKNLTDLHLNGVKITWVKEDKNGGRVVDDATPAENGVPF